MPLQEAPQSVSAGSALSAPLVPIPEYRARSFSEGVAERLREGAAKGVSEAEILATIRTERLALAAALDQETFRAAFAQSYFEQFNALNPAAPITIQGARAAIDDIVGHRINDARWLAELVKQPDFLNAVHAVQNKPRGEFQLPPEKIEEMIVHFSADPADGITHAQQSMAGQRVGHTALAKVYDEHNPLVNVLAKELALQLHDEEGAQRLAADWMQARRKPAVATVAVLEENGVVYQNVLQRINAANAAGVPAPKPAVVPPAGMKPTLQTTTALTPYALEKRKSSQHKAEDLIYTMNHALTCLSITDLFVMPVINGLMKVAFGKTAPHVGCGNPAHNHDHPKGIWHAVTSPFRNVAQWFRSDRSWGEKMKTLGSNAKNWAISEAVGDVGAVVPTIALQRYAPGFMHGIRTTLEPLVGHRFRHSTQKAAEHWAAKNGFTPDSRECVDRAQELYEYEMSHLPQMAIWTASSIGINYAVMKGFLDKQISVGEFAKIKGVGAAVTGGLVLGARSLSPNAAHGWDQSMGRHVAIPLTKIVGAPFGVRTKDVEDVAHRRDDDAKPVLQGRIDDSHQAITA